MEPSASSTPLLDRALYLLEAGFHVIPLGGCGETPPDHFVQSRFGGDLVKAQQAWPKTPRVSWRQYQFAPPDETSVRHWWGMWPSANIGIACGKLIVVDADSDDAAQWVRGNLTPTPWRVKTGKGTHFYYRENPELEIRNSADPLAKIDTRGFGGYVVASGSQHANGNFYTDEIEHGAEIALCDLPALQPADIDAIRLYRQGNMRSEVRGVGNLAGFDASRYATKHDGSPTLEGGRNNAAASLVGQYIQQGMSLRDITKLMASWNETNPVPLPEVELSTTIASVVATHTRKHPEQPVVIEHATAVVTTRDGSTPERFPLGLLNVPGLVGAIADYIDRTAIKPQPVLALGASLALCGALMGRKVRTRTNLRTNAYIIGVADSGAGKEHARKAIKRLLGDANAMHMLGERLGSDVGLFSMLMRSPSCLLLQDEIGRFFARIHGTKAAGFETAISTMLMELSGSADSRYIERLRAEHQEKDPRVIDNPNCVVYGTTVPGRLFQSLTPNEITDGFLPRILMFHSDDPDPVKRPLVDTAPDPDLVMAIQSWMQRSVNAYPAGNLDRSVNPLWVDTTPEAQLVFDQFEAANRARRAKTRRSGFDAMWARAKEHALRMALIRAAGAEFANPVIREEDATWACQLVEFLLMRALKEIGVNVASNEYEGTFKKVSDYAREHGTFSRRDIYRKFTNMRKDQLDAVLTRLIENEDIEPCAIVQKSRGRPEQPYAWTGGN